MNMIKCIVDNGNVFTIIQINTSFVGGTELIVSYDDILAVIQTNNISVNIRKFESFNYKIRFTYMLNFRGFSVGSAISAPLSIGHKEREADKYQTDDDSVVASFHCILLF